MKINTEKYPSTEFFSVIDTIPVPHPYMITSKHVAFASDNFVGRLSAACIAEGEKRGEVRRGHPGCDLDYRGHETALLVGAKKEDNELLREYLLSIKELAKQDGAAGFALKKMF